MDALAEKNAHLKGRKRFNADFGDMKAECGKGVSFQDLQVTRFRAGDDEGSMELAIRDNKDKHSFSITLMVSDTSDYPKNHSCFCYCSDEGASPKVVEALESISQASPRPIATTVQKLLTILHGALRKGMAGGHAQFSQTAESDDDDSEAEDYVMSDDDHFVKPAISMSAIDRSLLQRDFIEVVATGYRPGLITFSSDDFGLCISVPVVRLADTIPPRVLVAWDRRLLSKNRHITLLITGARGVYPLLDNSGNLTQPAVTVGANLSFRVGLTQRYKPGKEQARDECRTFGLIVEEAEDQLEKEKEKDFMDTDFDFDFEIEQEQFVTEFEEVDEEDEGSIDRFSLSSSLESLMQQMFLKVVQLRRQFGLGWAGAELLYSEMEKKQIKAEEIMVTMGSEILKADKIESSLSGSYNLPHDPLIDLDDSSPINLPLTAFCYLIRRLTLCPRYCMVCHNRIHTEFEVLKPYICDNKLCSYQYYSLNRGPSLEYEIIHNPQTVDLLVSLAYTSSSEGSLEDPLPVGMGLRVPMPSSSSVVQRPNVGYIGVQQAQTQTPQEQLTNPAMGVDGLVEFDALSRPQMRAAISMLIDSLPSIDQMRKHLMKKVRSTKVKPKLKEMDPLVLPAAWSILRWIIASCTAYLEEINDEQEKVVGLGNGWRQFRFSVGAPDAEAKFKAAIASAQETDSHARQYPSIYAFHGSPLRNWHSIVRHGLWFKTIAHGRAYGDGVYLAKDGNVSMGGYAQGGRPWSKSIINPTSCVALAEVVNLPSRFRSNNPYYVVQFTEWIVCRYLLVKTTSGGSKGGSGMAIPFVKLDPTRTPTVSNSVIKIPDPTHKLSLVMGDRRAEFIEEDNDEEDSAVFDFTPPPPDQAGSSSQNRQREVIEIMDSDDEDIFVPTTRPNGNKRDVIEIMDSDDDYAASRRSNKKKAIAKGVQRPADDWTHDPDWVNTHVAHLMPPPADAQPGAALSVQRELRAALKEQENAKSLRELGWYIPPELIEDNLFQWIVEMHSFDPSIPIAQDMKRNNVNSLIFEIRFPPTFPNSPPFFRIITPRFLPFIQGGGGHVTGGGSICMDLLTADGWLPSYSIPAVLMQIKLAISNLDPRPARLSQDWKRPYSPYEALEGFRRAAATHGWKVPAGLEKFVF
ncbi:hypothetical protein AX16_009819 [Volvariella volvacea WC 439]|nr:hypothetical protein AX16_009819 [Volvariella volvacea WC 439]